MAAAAAGRTAGGAAAAAGSHYAPTEFEDDEKHTENGRGGGLSEVEDDDDTRTLGGGRAGGTVAGGSTMTGATSARMKIAVEDVPFSLVCTLMQRVLVAKRLQKEKLMTTFWRSIYKPYESLYPLMRLLLPQLDSARATYGLRESSLGDVYIAALGLSKTLDQAMRLKSYKAPHRGGGAAGGAGSHTTSGSVSGEFTLVLLDVLRKYISVPENSSRLTVGDINALLDTLAQDREKGSPARSAVFKRCVAEMSPSENMWFCRIILKDLKMGMKHESMLKLFDSDALDIYNACSSLQQVCESVAKPGRQKETFSAVDYFRACKPMLASSPAWNEAVGKMKGHAFFIEDKYDGERLLLHKRGNEVKLFTRKSIDYTNRYNYGTTFTPVVLQALAGHDCIVDGELVTFDTATGQYLKFGSNRTIALAGPGLGDTKQLCYIAFDILKLDDTVLLDKPLSFRREILTKLVKPQVRRFEVIEHRTDVHTSQGLLSALTEAVGLGKEGIIVKDSTSPYVLNDRSDWWIKVKPDYVDGLRDDMDLILMGGYYGEGTRRSGGISHFLLGLHERKLTPAEAAALSADRRRLPPKLYAFCKVGSGYSIERLGQLRRELESKWQKYDPARQPPHFMGWKHERSDVPEVWIDPRDAPCFQIKCYEITECRPNKFSAGYTCRFPRVVQIRDDKEWSDCMTRDEMLALAAPAKRQSVAALGEYEDELISAAGGGGAAAAEKGGYVDQGIGLDELMRREAEQHADRKVKPEPRLEWGGDEDLAAAAARPPAAVVHSTQVDLLSPPPAAADSAYIPGLPPHMQGEGAGGVEVGAQYAEGNGAYDWRQGDDGGDSIMHPGAGLASEAAAAAASGAGGVGGTGFGIGLGDAPLPGGKRKKGGKRKAKDALEKKNGVKRGDKSFCILSTDRHPDKAELEKLIASHGGSFTQNPMEHTFVILAKWEDTIKVSVQKKAGNKVRISAIYQDILHYSWLLDSVAAGRLLPFSSRYVIQGTRATAEALAREVDVYGDSYTMDVDVAALEGALAEVARRHPHPFEPAAAGGAASTTDPRAPRFSPTHSMPSTLQLHLAKPAPASYRPQLLLLAPEQRAALASPVRAAVAMELFVYGERGSTALSLAALTLRMLGARLTEVLSRSVTHILHAPRPAASAAAPDGASAESADTFTLEALRACMEGVGLQLAGDVDDADLSLEPPGLGGCWLITPAWAEEQRRRQTEELNHGAGASVAAQQ